MVTYCSRVVYCIKDAFLVLFWLIVVTQVKAQDEAKPNPGSIISFNIGLGGNIPLADLKNRYGNNLSFSLGSAYITKNNWIINGDFFYFYGENVKEDVLFPLRTKNGDILGDDNQLAEVFGSEVGFFVGVGVGKLFPFSPSSRSGLKVSLQGGILQHQIKFSDQRNSVAQIRAGRDLGYDRLSRGFSLKQTVAYKHLSNNKRLNFEFALDFIQGFTSEVRAINFDTGLPTMKDRLDMLIGARIVWVLPFYNGTETTIYY